MFKLTSILVFALALIVLVVSSDIVLPARPTRPPRPTRPTRPTRTPRTTTTTTTTTVRPPPDVVQTEGCGGVLEGHSGLISYAIGNTRLPNGIVCVWTIRSPGTGRILVNIDEESFSSGGNGNYITIFNVGEEASLEKAHKISAANSTAATYGVDGQVAFVIFRASSGSPPETGFQLYFRGDANFNEDSSLWTGGNKTHVHFHYNRAQGTQEQFSYPNPRAQYGPDEFGSWVLNPEHPNMLNYLSLYYLDFEDFSCRDFIKIYQVDGDYPKFLEKRCNTNTYFSGSFYHQTVREPFIITYNSDWRNQRSGFILYYSNDRNRWDQD